MKRELCAIILLIAVFSISIWNIHYVDRVTEELLSYLDRSAEYADAGDCETAAEVLTVALNRWKKLDRYSGVAIRHAETDSCTDLFYELLGELYQENTGTAQGMFQSLSSHLKGIAEMEHLTLESIF
ncbi:MAG: DUF4363 family protein [Oscillospiraceae bacterium]|jgi:hypothetical protein